jgi:hypothetical protein
VHDDVGQDIDEVLRFILLRFVDDDIEDYD